MLDSSGKSILFCPSTSVYKPAATIFAPDGKDWLSFDPLHPQEEHLDKIYSADMSIILKAAPQNSSSQPSVMAPMFGRVRTCQRYESVGNWD